MYESTCILPKLFNFSPYIHYFDNHMDAENQEFTYSYLNSFCITYYSLPASNRPIFSWIGNIFRVAHPTYATYQHEIFPLASSFMILQWMAYGRRVRLKNMLRNLFSCLLFINVFLPGMYRHFSLNKRGNKRGLNSEGVTNALILMREFLFGFSVSLQPVSPIHDTSLKSTHYKEW